MEESLLAKIGLDISDLKAKAIEGTEAIHGIHGKFRELKQLLELGGIAMAVERVFSTLEEHAKKSKDLLDEDTQAVVRFAETQEEFKDKVLDLGVTILGTYNRAGEAIGDAIARMMYGDAQVNKAAQIAKDSAEAMVELAKKRAATAEAFAEAEKHINDLLAKREEMEFSQLSHAEQRARLTNEIVAAQELAGTMEEKSLAHEQLKVVILEKQNKLIKVLGEDRKQEDAAAAAAIQADKDAKAEVHMAEMDAIDERKKEQADYNASVAEQIGLEEEATAEVRRQADAIDAAARKWTGFTQSFNSVGGSVQTLNDTQLSALIVKLQSRQSLQQAAHFGDNNAAYDPLLQETNLMLSNAQREQSIRRDFSRDVGAFGQDYAMGAYSAQDFSRLMQLINPDTAKKQASDITSISTSLRNLNVALNIPPG